MWFRTDGLTVFCSGVFTLCWKTGGTYCTREFHTGGLLLYRRSLEFRRFGEVHLSFLLSSWCTYLLPPRSALRSSAHGPLRFCTRVLTLKNNRADIFRKTQAHKITSVEAIGKTLSTYKLGLQWAPIALTLMICLTPLSIELGITGLAPFELSLDALAMRKEEE